MEKMNSEVIRIALDEITKTMDKAHDLLSDGYKYLALAEKYVTDLKVNMQVYGVEGDEDEND